MICKFLNRNGGPILINIKALLFAFYKSEEGKHSVYFDYGNNTSFSAHFDNKEAAEQAIHTIYEVIERERSQSNG